MDADGEISFTDLGWAQKSPIAPRRHDMHWLTPKGEIYAWDGDDVGWVRIKPPQTFPSKELNHG
jgi:hypothetical protein